MFNVPELSYDYEALEPVISRDIMRLHRDKHHQAYVDKLNQAVENAPELKDRSIEDLLTNLDTLPEAARTAIRNNGGGHYNHSLFWQWMSPSGGGEPSGELAEGLSERYGNFQGFVDEFTEKALGVFGSGWAWLMPDMDIITTSNQDNPIMEGRSAPILGLDVWEHAYYLDYKNVRADYVTAWWGVVNWEFVQSGFAQS
jgi:Fe-Mn family superoxide dismutase